MTQRSTGAASWTLLRRIKIQEPNIMDPIIHHVWATWIKIGPVPVYMWYEGTSYSTYVQELRMGAGIMPAPLLRVG